MNDFRVGSTGGILHTSPEGEHVVRDVAVFEDVRVRAAVFGCLHYGAHGQLHLLQRTRTKFGAQNHRVVERVDDGAAYGIRILLVVQEAVDERVEILEILRQVERTGERSERVHIRVHHTVVEGEELAQRGEYAFRVAAEPEQVVGLRRGDECQRVLAGLLQHAHDLRAGCVIMLHAGLFGQYLGVLETAAL